MHSYQQAHLNFINPQTIILYEFTIDRLNAVLTYIEFFKSSMTDWELLTAIQDQMDKYVISKQFINNLYDIFTRNCHRQSPVTLASVTLASVKLYEIITELESKCKHDLTNKQQ